MYTFTPSSKKFIIYCSVTTDRRIKFDHFFPIIILGFGSTIEFVNKNTWIGSHLCLLNALIHLEIDCYLSKIGMYLFSRSIMWHETRFSKWHSDCISSFPLLSFHTTETHYRVSVDACHKYVSFSVTMVLSPVSGPTSSWFPNPLLWGSYLHVLSFLPFSGLTSKSLNFTTLTYTSIFHYLCKTTQV